MSFKKSRLIPGKIPSEKVQLEFVKEMNILLDHSRKEDSDSVVLYLDPVHQIYNTENGYSWQVVGKSGTKQIFSNCGRRRLNIIGAVNPISLEITSIVTEVNCNQFLMESFLSEIKKAYINLKTITIILDNASYNKGYLVVEKAKLLGIDLLYLPPYSPNLNLIERLWKFFKKEIMQSIYYPTFNDFYSSVLSFFEKPEKYKDNLATLLATNFEIIKAS